MLYSVPFLCECKYFVNVKYHQWKDPESLSENFSCLRNEFSGEEDKEELRVFGRCRLGNLINLINKGQRKLNKNADDVCWCNDIKPSSWNICSFLTTQKLAQV